MKSSHPSKSPNMRSAGTTSKNKLTSTGRSRGSNERTYTIGGDTPAKKLIAELTQGKVNVDDNTILLINETEVLAKDGIHGKIASVGIGFGTGRHTEGRRSIITNQINKVMQKNAPPLMID